MVPVTEVDPMRTTLRFVLATIVAGALALTGCEAGFKDISPPQGKSAANGATPKAAFAGPSVKFEYPDAAAGDATEDPGL
jgi:hypothetical protein